LNHDKTDRSAVAFGDEDRLVPGFGNLLHVGHAALLAVRFDAPVCALPRVEARHLVPEFRKNTRIVRFRLPDMPPMMSAAA
jgi:hypothetical protein